MFLEFVEIPSRQRLRGNLPNDLSDPGEREGIDFLRKANAAPVTPGIPPTKSLGERIDFFEKSIPF